MESLNAGRKITTDKPCLEIFAMLFIDILNSFVNLRLISYRNATKIYIFISPYLILNFHKNDKYTVDV